MVITSNMHILSKPAVFNHCCFSSLVISSLCIILLYVFNYRPRQIARETSRKTVTPREKGEGDLEVNNTMEINFKVNAQI